MRLPSLAFWLVTPAALGLLSPDPAGAAGPAPANSAPLIRDVALADDSSLIGTVVDRQGRPMPGVDVLLLQTGRAAARTVTAADGRFQVRHASGGIYEISAAGGAGVYRIWQCGAAPPGAVRSAVIVADSAAVRGQSPRTGFFRSDAFLISAAVVGAVAIPIFISAARRESPPGS